MALEVKQLDFSNFFILFLLLFFFEVIELPSKDFNFKVCGVK
jgi:hypothetical protein